MDSINLFSFIKAPTTYISQIKKIVIIIIIIKPQKRNFGSLISFPSLCTWCYKISTKIKLDVIIELGEGGNPLFFNAWLKK